VRGLEDVQRGSGGGRCTGYVLRINPDAYKSWQEREPRGAYARAREEMDNIRDNWMPDGVTGTDELSMSWCMHMYYDGDDRTVRRCLKRSCATNYTHKKQVCTTFFFF
jgi:hypothetical protein